MARQYKVEATYVGPPVFTAQLYWHDDNTIEFTAVPTNTRPNTLIGRTELLANLIDYMKTEKVSKVEATKLP